MSRRSQRSARRPGRGRPAALLLVLVAALVSVAACGGPAPSDEVLAAGGGAGTGEVATAARAFARPATPGDAVAESTPTAPGQALPPMAAVPDSADGAVPTVPAAPATTQAPTTSPPTTAAPPPDPPPSTTASTVPPTTRAETTTTTVATTAPAPTDQPPPDDPVEEIVEFRIAAGTGSGPWNSFDDPVRVQVGQILRIHNDDSVAHGVHAGGTPIKHGPQIRPGGYADHRILRPFQPVEGSVKLYDHKHGRKAPFWIVADG